MPVLLYIILLYCFLGCAESLTTKKGKTGYLSSFSASSVGANYFPSKGRITSTDVWIPEPFNKLNRDSPDYLQVDLGSSKAITAVETRGHALYYVTKFEIWLSHHGKSFFQHQEGNQTVCVIAFHIIYLSFPVTTLASQSFYCF